MLWYKAWMESRARFLTALAMIGFLTLPWVLFQAWIIAHVPTEIPRPIHYYDYIHGTIYTALTSLLFLVFAIVLALGGLSRERSHGTAFFTLALPVTRLQLVTVRAIAGLAQLAVLSFLPTLVICGLSPLVHQCYPFSQAVQFSCLWFAGGAICYAFAFLFSVLASGEYFALGGSLAIFSVYLVAIHSPFRTPPSLNVLLVVTGYAPAFHSSMAGTQGWISLTSVPALESVFGYVLAATACLVASVLITTKQDF